MNESGTIAAVLARIELLERRVVALEAAETGRHQMLADEARHLQARQQKAAYEMQSAQRTNTQ
jgi:hypothetical protein